MYILGVSAYYHDSAAVLIKDGEVLCAIEEERFTRVKHDNSFPIQAIEWCLRDANITISDIAVISYYEKPLLKFERSLDIFIKTWPKSLISFIKNMPELLGEKLSVDETIRKKLSYQNKIVFIPHHLSHASAAFYSSPFKTSAILTIDGVGEYQTTALWKASKDKLQLVKDIHFPHSLGLFYSTCAAYLGFKVNEDEYKLMGLAAYGKPIYVSKLKQIIKVKEDGSFNLNMDYFAFQETTQMWSYKLEELLGKSRQPQEKITKKHVNIAKSVQVLTEQIYIAILNYLYTVTKEENICISGGVALNALANGLIYSRTHFKHSHVFGPAGDSGAALGSALFTYYNHHPDKNQDPKKRSIDSLSLGSQYADREIEATLKKYNLTYKKLSEKELVHSAANALSEGKIIGWFQGRCELGPRALGNRSILCKTFPKSMKTKVNVIKIREQFRPFAGSILQDYVHEYFEVPEQKYSSPFMNYCFTVKKSKRKELAAIIHKDNTCRIQTVSPSDRLYYKLIEKFYGLTGIPCIL
ncbi:MAG: hypothetical protein NTV98_04755, partial [Candidatus Roizmanbacteria bacterium]|nr:hypothetical protein [Candidatus Roizmanbacteria bacterium]